MSSTRSIPERTCLLLGDTARFLGALAGGGWATTADPARHHHVALAAGPLALLRLPHTAPLLLVPPGGTSSAGRAAALAAGADDVAPDPCDMAELLARLDALVRRPGAAGAPIRCADLAIDPLRRSATRGGNALPLLPREYDLLHHLAGEAGRVVSRLDLLRQVWRLPFDPCTNVVEVHVSRLRGKLDRGFARPLLHTVRGRGYALAERRPLD